MRENEIYLDSWEAKSKALSASWNEFVNTFLNADMFKGFIGGATEVLKWLTDVNAMLPIFVGVLAGLGASVIPKITIAIKTLFDVIKGGAVWTNIATGGIPMLIGLATTLAGVLISWGVSAGDTAKQIEKLNTKIQEQQTEIDKLTAKEKDVVDLYKEYESLMSKSKAYGLNASEKENLLNISKELVDTYGLEVSGIDEVTGAYVVGANAINDYVEALRNERNIKNEEQTKTRNQRIDKNIDKVKENKNKDPNNNLEFKDKFWVSGNWAQAENKNEELLELIGINDKKPWWLNDNSFYGDKLAENYDVLLENYDKVMNSEVLSDEEKKRLENWADAYRSEATKIKSETQAITNSIVKDILTNIQVGNADMLDSNSESLLTQMLTPYLTTVDWDKFDKDEFETKVKEFANGASSGLVEVAAKLKDSQAKMMSGDMNLSGYTDMYDTLQNKSGLLKQMLDQGIIDQQSYEQQVSQIYSQVANNIGLSMAEIAGKISETDKQSRQNFKNVADNFIALENQFKQGKISSVEYITSITETIENMDFKKTFGENTEAAQQFFSTLANKSANILQDTITQFESGKMSVKDYGDNLKNFAKQQKELAKNAIEEAKALGMSEDAVKALSDEYEKSGAAIDEAVKKWEELDDINAYLDKNIETLRTTTNAATDAYQSFATGLYSEFTKLSDNMQSQIISDMQKMEGLGHITAENLKAEMAKSTSASAGLASAVASKTNDVFKNLANNGGKVLTELGNAIKNFKYTITFNPNAKFSGGEFDLKKWATSGGKEGIKLPSISWDITGKAGGGAAGLGDALSNFGNSLSVVSDLIDVSDYGGSSGGGGSGNGGGSGGGGSKGSGSDKNKPDYEDPTEAIINRINLRANELEQQEEYIQNALEIAEIENDYEKQISLTNDLINNRKKRIEELNKANAGLHNEAEYLRNTNKWDEASWFNGQGEATEAYYKVFNSAKTKEEQEQIKNLFESLSKYKKAYADNAEEIVSLNKEILQDEENLWDIRREIFDERMELSDTYIQNSIDFGWENGDTEIKARKRVLDWIESDYYRSLIKDDKEYYKILNENRLKYNNALTNKFNKGTEFGSSYLESKKALLQSYYDVTNSIAEAQHEINKELETSKTMYEYLDEETRKLLFNQEDYNELSDELFDIQQKADRLQRQYQRDLDNSTLETIEQITSNYQMQYETLMKSYEIAKADLEIAKKKQKLNNVLNERKVRMFINGSWQWVANTEDVINAKSELADAQYAKQVEEAGLTQKQSIDALTKQQNELGVVIKQFENGVIDLDKAIYLAEQAIGKLPSAIATIFNDAKGSSSGSSGSRSKSSSGGIIYSQQEIDSMSPAERSAAWYGASAESQYYLHEANKNALSNSHTYDDATGTWKKKEYATGTRYTDDGLALMGEDGFEAFISSNGRLIPIIGNISSGGVVFNTDQMKSLRTLWDMSNLSLGGGSFITNTQSPQTTQTYDNRIIINGMTVDSGSVDGQAVISALRRYVGNH